MPDIDKNCTDIRAQIGQLAPRISSKSIKSLILFIHLRYFQEIRATNSAIFSLGGNIVVFALSIVFSSSIEKKLAAWTQIKDNFDIFFIPSDTEDSFKDLLIRT